MPLNHADKPFVSATITGLDKLPIVIKGSDDDNQMVQIFNQLNIIPHVAIVKPYPGYGKLLKNKYDKIHTMARATRLITGEKMQHLDEKTLRYGFDLRNIVWGHAMLQTIASSVMSSLYTNPVDKIEVVLDRKTMKSSMRNLFKEMIINGIGNGIKQFLSTIRKLNPSKIYELEKRAEFSSKTTILRWSDESESLEKSFGLRLADRFSRKIYKSQTTNQAGIEELLKNAGYTDFIYDISELLTHIDNRLIDNFKRNTGLPEPKKL